MPQSPEDESHFELPQDQAERLRGSISNFVDFFCDHVIVTECNHYFFIKWSGKRYPVCALRLATITVEFCAVITWQICQCLWADELDWVTWDGPFPPLLSYEMGWSFPSPIVIWNVSSLNESQKKISRFQNMSGSEASTSTTTLVFNRMAMFQ